MDDAALILEGGGMRGVYTAGVLDFFLENSLKFPACYGVSAGACHASSYLSGQRGRALAVCTDYLDDKRYCSYRSLLKTGDLFGAEMLYDIIPNQLNLYDYEAFRQNPCRFFAVLTDCETGRAVYWPVKDMRRDIIAVRASSSLPIISRMVEIEGRKYLDGGIADSIPLARAMADGHRKNVVVLTQHPTYRKGPNHFTGLAKLKYRRYPALVQAVADRHIHYNEALELVAAETEAGRAFILQPQKPVTISRTEHDADKLRELYQEGYRDAKRNYDDLQAFLAD